MFGRFIKSKLFFFLFYFCERVIRARIIENTVSHKAQIYSLITKVNHYILSVLKVIIFCFCFCFLGVYYILTQLNLIVVSKKNREMSLPNVVKGTDKDCESSDHNSKNSNSPTQSMSKSVVQVISNVEMSDLPIESDQNKPETYRRISLTVQKNPGLRDIIHQLSHKECQQILLNLGHINPSMIRKQITSVKNFETDVVSKSSSDTLNEQEISDIDESIHVLTEEEGRRLAKRMGYDTYQAMVSKSKQHQLLGEALTDSANADARSRYVTLKIDSNLVQWEQEQANNKPKDVTKLERFFGLKCTTEGDIQALKSIDPSSKILKKL